MPLIASPTDADRRAKQREAYTVLADILTIGDQQNLPVLTWAVSAGALVGQSLSADMVARRDAYDLWVAALGLAQHTEIPSDGMLQLHAVTANYQGGVDVGVTADILQDLR